MEKAQEIEWAEAQKIAVSIDLVEATKIQLNFLVAVYERNRFLFEDQTLQRAIYRYNAFWLPLLAKHSEKPVSEEPLVVPLDCELIWHCHRLNPMRYKSDCEKLFGRILGNDKVVSSTQVTSKTTTEKIWSKMFPEEPYELDLSTPLPKDILENSSQNEKFTSYDLIAAVKRQIQFTYQACRPHLSDELFLREAEARYKGYLHIIRRNREMNLKRSCVPTCDIDLIWHTHQLFPESYCKDTTELVGFLIQHNDYKEKGSGLDNGFSETTKLWEQTFGSSYWRAGGMNRGDIPTPVPQVPYEFNIGCKDFDKNEKCGLQIQFPNVKYVEVLLDFVDIKNIPEEQKENLRVAFSKNQPDKLFDTKQWLGISSASKDKLFAFFQCEPKGEFLFELMSESPNSNELKTNKLPKLLGSCSLSVEKVLASRSQLSINEWVSVDLDYDLGYSEPALLHVSMSFSPPMTAYHVFQLVQSQPFKNDQIQTQVIDYWGKKVFSLQKRNVVRDATKSSSDLLTEVYCITDSGEKHALVEFHGDYWCLKGTHGSFMVQTNSGNDDSPFDLIGSKTLRIFPGKRLEFEPRQSDEKSEQDFKTVVEFSTEYPYGRAVALINSKSGTITINDESIILPAISITFILSDFPKGDDMVKNKGSGWCDNCVDGVGENLGSMEAADWDKMAQMKKEVYRAPCTGTWTCFWCQNTSNEAAQMKKEVYRAPCTGTWTCFWCQNNANDTMHVSSGPVQVV